MTKRAPGRSYRNGISLVEFMRLFPDDAAAEAWFEETRWPDGIRCPRCDADRINENAKHPTMRHRCKACRRYFSFKTNTVMQDSKLGAHVWLLATYLLTTNLKGTSSMKLHRDLELTQKSAWHLAHRIRESWHKGHAPFAGPVEADEVYLGGKAKNKPKSKRQRIGGGTRGKQAVIGVKDRATNQVRAAAIATTDWETLSSYVRQYAEPETTVYTDDHLAYRGVTRKHAAVKHSTGEYVRGDVHTQGIESFWSLLKRGYYGTYHRMSREHVQRYVDEFAGRHNGRTLDTLDQMRAMARGMVGKRLQYKELIA